MGEATDITLNGNSHQTADPESVEQIRSDIERTRDEMSTTIDALQNRLDPQKLKAQAMESARDATVGKAQQIAHSAQDKFESARAYLAKVLSPAAEKFQAKLHPTTDSVVASKRAAAEGTGSFLKPIHEQVVVVFGASSGIGRETAIQFARRGAKVVVAARSEDGVSTLVDSIRRAGGEGEYQVADVANFEQVQAVAQKAIDSFGRLDTWVHCAAVSLYATAENTTSEEFRRVHEVNFLGTVHGVQAALPHLKAQGQGALICISSVEGKRAFPYQAAYASSKHAVIGFLETLRLELVHGGFRNISVTNVMPAGINTPFFNKARTKLGVKPMPAPPIYQPSVVADAILFAAEHPTRDIFAGGAAKMFAIFQRLSPAMTDAMLLQMGFKGQETNEPKEEERPDNLYAPIDGYNHVGGDFMTQAKATSIGTWLETHPAAQRAIKGAALGLAVVWLLRRR